MKEAAVFTQVSSLYANKAVAGGVLLAVLKVRHGSALGTRERQCLREFGSLLNDMASVEDTSKATDERALRASRALGQGIRVYRPASGSLSEFAGKMKAIAVTATRMAEGGTATSDQLDELEDAVRQFKQFYAQSLRVHRRGRELSGAKWSMA
ncbi:MAG: hypothetical protein IH869_00035 [Chloroflexi bacterium]|nr:hypothetical protein [Chloroflexota bacterium]